jgi:hypothetical protein
MSRSPDERSTAWRILLVAVLFLAGSWQVWRGVKLRETHLLHVRTAANAAAAELGLQGEEAEHYVATTVAAAPSQAWGKLAGSGAALIALSLLGGGWAVRSRAAGKAVRDEYVAAPAQDRPKAQGPLHA